MLTFISDDLTRVDACLGIDVAVVLDKDVYANVSAGLAGKRYARSGSNAEVII
jgi:hypothetical protein